MNALNFNSKKAQEVFEKVVAGLPEDVEVYIVSGAIRNAVFRELHGEVLTQRDYDQVTTAGSKEYIAYLKSLDFENGNIQRETQKMLVKSLTRKPSPEGYKDWLVFDIHTMDGTTIMENLKYHSGFTINGFALNIKDATADDWMDKLIMLPEALNDMKKKQLRVNLDGYKEHSPNLLACIRFMSAGFAPPPPKEVDLLLKELPRAVDDNYQKRIQKVWDYVGDEQKAQQLAKSLNLPVDVFNEQEMKSKLQGTST